MIPVAALRRFHAVATVAWLVLSVPAVLWWRTSIAFLVFVSVYTVVVNHAGAWQGARAEGAAEGA